MIDIGIIPPLDIDKIEACGNTSLKGAIQGCLSSEASKAFETIVDKLEFIELNAQEGFQNDFINALFIPHLKLDFKNPQSV